MSALLSSNNTERKYLLCVFGFAKRDINNHSRLYYASGNLFGQRIVMEIIEAIYEKGVFRPIHEVDIKEGERVEIQIKTEDKRDPAYDLADIAMDTGIPDFAENIDHYLYGLPKQTER